MAREVRCKVIDRQTHTTTTVALAVHVRRGLITKVFDTAVSQEFRYFGKKQHDI